MARNLIVINVDLRETRVALIENGVVAELQIERASHRGTVGDIVLGRVTRVLPGMQAAFIDVGHERAAFLHVEDLIRPNDLEAYLSGGPLGDEESSFRGDGTRPGSREPLPREASDAQRAEADDDDDDDDAEEDRITVVQASSTDSSVDSDNLAQSDDGDDAAEEPENGNNDLGDADDDVTASELDEDDSEADDEGDDDDLLEDADDVAATPHLEGDEEHDEGWEAPASPEAQDPHTAYVSGLGSEPVPNGDGPDSDTEATDDEPDSDTEATDDEPDSDTEATDDEPDSDDEPVVAVEASENGTAAVQASESDPSARQGRGRRRRRKRRRSGAGERQPEARQPEARDVKRDPSPRSAPREQGRDASALRNNRRGKATPLRVTRSVPITEVVREGDEVIVQVSKEPIGTKGARVTSHVSLPGRYVVYLPTVDHIGISKRIGSARERGRLRQVIDTLKPAKGGLIVRTVAEGLTKKQLKADIGYLIRLWGEVFKRKEGAKAPEILYTELDLVLKVARDLFTDEVDHVVIDDRDQYGRLVRFVEMFMPERVSAIELYQSDEPIFDAYGIEDEIGRALSRKVPLPSGGSLIVDQAEALTAIDVNTGRYVGKGSRDLEETALKTNLEAVEEIAYQLRFRNIGGLVILDLIDMEKPGNREKVWRSLEHALAKDKAKTTINRISDLGLIEMTRKRTRESLGRVLHEPCFYCDGTGQIQSRETIAYEILRQIRRERMNLPGYSVIVNAHPAVVDFLKGEARDALHEAERRFARKIELVARQEYHIEQSDLQGK